MTIKETLKRAVETQNAVAAGRIADALREQGLRYSEIYALARDASGVSEADWEALMYEADTAT